MSLAAAHDGWQMEKDQVATAQDVVRLIRRNNFYHAFDTFMKNELSGGGQYPHRHDSIKRQIEELGIEFLENQRDWCLDSEGLIVRK
jgi:hypothetical protein